MGIAMGELELFSCRPARHQLVRHAMQRARAMTSRQLCFASAVASHLQCECCCEALAVGSGNIHSWDRPAALASPGQGQVMGEWVEG